MSMLPHRQPWSDRSFANGCLLSARMAVNSQFSFLFASSSFSIDELQYSNHNRRVCIEHNGHSKHPFKTSKRFRRNRNGLHIILVSLYSTPSLMDTRTFASLATSNDSSTNDTSEPSLVPFLLADIGEGIAQVEILEWYIEVGDVLQQFDRVCLVQSDKATVEITSRYDGIVHSLHANGRTNGTLLKVGQPLLHLASTMSPHIESESALYVEEADDGASSDDDNNDEDATKGLESNESSRREMAVTSKRQEEVPMIHMSPAVRKLGREHAIDLVTLAPGSGPGGRILKADVLSHIVKKQQQELKPTNNTGNRSSPPSAAVLDSHTIHDLVIPLRGYRRQMAKAMENALETPHMCLSDELVLNQLLLARQHLNDTVTGSSSCKVSVLALLCKAVSCAMLEFPIVNSHLTTVKDESDETDEIAILQRADHNIGIAMDTSRGLVVPVIRQCQRKSILEIQFELDRLKFIASNSNPTFASQDLQDATFTISNIGSMGAGLSVHPVLAPPALAMMALGKIQTLPRFHPNDNSKDDTDGSLELSSVYAASVMTVTYAADHRYLDGATLARLHTRLALYTQQPLTMLARLT